MVAFLLGLCNVDPITYNLLFERFMDPSRNEMPDIDIDICQDGRQRVIEYVPQKYGHVAQIITFGTLAAKAACKDVGRVLGVPLAEIDRLTKLIPPTPGMTLKRAIDAVPELDQFIKSSPMIAKVIDYATKLEGMARNAGCHAAGVIIADQPLDGIVPLYRDSDGNVLTQFEGPVAEKCGLLKMDFLGLRTLTSLTRSIDLEFADAGDPAGQVGRRPARAGVRPARPVRGRQDRPDRPRVYKLFQRGETRAVFQFESGGMQDLLMKMVPDRIEDLIAANALYRPGPMELIPTYCARKHGKEPVPQVHPIMDSILAETYGIMCIHEDARVSMADGTERPIKDVRRGDRVHSLDYSTRRFDIKECHGCGPTRKGDGVRITLENGYSVTLTDDHKVLTYSGLKEAANARRRVGPGRRRPGTGPGAAVYRGDCRLARGRRGRRILVRGVGRRRVPDHVWHHDRHRPGAGPSPVRQVGGSRLPRPPRPRLLPRPQLVREPVRGEHPQLLNQAGHGNRKKRLTAPAGDARGLRTKASGSGCPSSCSAAPRQCGQRFLAGLLDADGCTAVTDRGTASASGTSTSAGLLEDVRRLVQMEGVPATIRKNRIQFWGLRTLAARLKPFLLVREFAGTLTDGNAVGAGCPGKPCLDAIPERESVRAFGGRTGIMRADPQARLPVLQVVHGRQGRHRPGPRPIPPHCLGPSGSATSSSTA